MVDANNIITTDEANHKDFYLKFNNIYVEKPMIEQDLRPHPLTPNECRIRDLTYAAPIYVDIEYTRGMQIVKAKTVKIGMMPIMLGSSNCWLDRKSFDELAKI